MIKNFENQYKQLYPNFIILNKMQHGNIIEYELYNNNFKTENKIYIHDDYINDIKYINDILSQYNDFTILNHYIENNFLYIVTKECKQFFEVRLRNNDLKEFMEGILYIRSKDYYFEYTNDIGEVKRMYGDTLTSDMIKDNKIISKNYNIEYILK
jgi:hypothetical protein